MNDERVSVGSRLSYSVVRMGQEGDGVAVAPDGRWLFIAGALPGETGQAVVTEVRRSFVRARAVSREGDSPDRIDPRCPVYQECGGCRFQHWDYAAELRYKEERVERALAAFVDPATHIDPISGADDPYGYRNKGQFPWGGQEGDLRLGLYQPRSHHLVPLSECAIQHPLINRVLAKAPAVANRHRLSPYREDTREGLLRHLVIRASQKNEALALVVVTRDDPRLPGFARDLMEACPGLAGVGVNINEAVTNRILGPTTRSLAGADHLFEEIGGMRFRLSLTSFFQVNPGQVSRLYGRAIDATGPEPKEVWDLYAGVGTLAALAAGKAKRVRALEISPDAILDARQNFLLNGLANVTIAEGAAEALIGGWIAASKGGPGPDAVILDPPRTGARPPVISALMAARPRRLVYVSCNPDTLARDVGLLVSDFRLARVSPVDMFPRTDHVEVCVEMHRR